MPIIRVIGVFAPESDNVLSESERTSILNCRNSEADRAVRIQGAITMRI